MKSSPLPFAAIAWITALTLALAACGSKRDAALGAAAPQHYGGAGPADSLFLSLERTPCLGPCKGYRIVVYRSGLSTYEGITNMEKMGPHRGRIGPDTLARILAEAERIGFFDLRDRYDAEVTDLPSTIIRLVADGRDKQVTGRYGQPETFKAFARQLDEWLLPVPWVPVPPAE